MLKSTGFTRNPQTEPFGRWRFDANREIIGSKTDPAAATNAA